MNIDQLGSLKSDNRMNRITMLVCTVISIGSAVFFYVDSKKTISNISTKRIVIDRENRAWLATEKELTSEQRNIQAKEHMRDFYKLFFAFDANTFDSTVNRALDLVDAKVGKAIYIKEYVEGKMARKVKEGNWKVVVDVSRVDCDFGVYPIQGKIFAVQTVIRSAGEVKRNLNGTFKIVTTGVSYENPRGYLITEFDLFDTSIIRTNK